MYCVLVDRMYYLIMLCKLHAIGVQARAEAIDTSCQYSPPPLSEIGLQCDMLIYNPSSESELSDNGIDTQHDSSFILSEESLNPS